MKRSRFLIRPAQGTPWGAAPPLKDPEYLSKDAALRLTEGDIVFELCVQRFVDETLTPIEDTAVPWREEDAPPEPVATITIPKSDVELRRGAHALAFDRGPVVQSVEHHRRVPSARQSQPRPQGCL